MEKQLTDKEKVMKLFHEIGIRFKDYDGDIELFPPNTFQQFYLEFDEDGKYIPNK